MPHIHIASFKRLPMPAEAGDCRFDFIATNSEYANEHLIATEVEGKRFFLLVKEGEQEAFSKATRSPAPQPPTSPRRGCAPTQS